MFLSSRKYDPGCSFRVRIFIFYPSRILKEEFLECFIAFIFFFLTKSSVPNSVNPVYILCKVIMTSYFYGFIFYLVTFLLRDRNIFLKNVETAWLAQKTLEIDQKF
jgi:hypothetical protein